MIYFAQQRDSEGKGMERQTALHPPEHAASFRNPAMETTSSRRHMQLRTHARTNETNTISGLDSHPPPPITFLVYFLQKNNKKGGPISMKNARYRG